MQEIGSWDCFSFPRPGFLLGHSAVHVCSSWDSMFGIDGWRVLGSVGIELQRHECKPSSITHCAQEIGSWDCFFSLRPGFFLGRSVV